MEDVVPNLLKKFNDKTYSGQTNYEDLVQYLIEAKERVQRSLRDEAEANTMVHEIQTKMEERKARHHQQRQQQNSPGSNHGQERTDRPFSFNDRDDAGLILELEKTLSDSPKFNLGSFKADLHAKDMYGNDQVSKQQVLQAAHNSNLNIDRGTLGQWLSNCDPHKRGIYNIPKLVRYLERSQPHILEMRRGPSASSTQAGNMGKRGSRKYSS